MTTEAKGTLLAVLQAPVITFLYLATAASLLYLAYLWALPKPIPGIPYDERASKRLLGNLPEIREHKRRTGRVRSWIFSQPQRHNSALVQVWLGPFQKPSLILADFQEAQDILLRRSKEFDRSKKSLQSFAGPVPNHHIAMASSDPRFKGNKDIVRDLMTPAFLHQVSAPQIHAKTVTLIDLWTLKARIADGRPFDAREDILDAAVDIINAAAFGLDDSMSTVKDQLNALITLEGKGFPINSDGSIQFPRVPQNPEIAAIQAIGDHIGEQFKSMFPRFHHHYKVLTHPTLSNNIARKEKLIYDEIEKALVRLRSGTGETRSAMDHIIQREIGAAAKAGRKPYFHSRRIHDEAGLQIPDETEFHLLTDHLPAFRILRGRSRYKLHSFVMYVILISVECFLCLCLFVLSFGTANTHYNAGMIKNMADYPDAQKNLRSALRSAYATAYSNGRQPTAVEVWKTPVPYLDAVLEESLRMDPPVPVTNRETTVGTVLLGHKIPKGTNVFFVGNGPDFQHPSLPFPDAVRRESSRVKHAYGRWDPADMHQFKPERWLKVNADGKEVYDNQSGPILAFSLGPRSCFGRRLAYLETRIVLALLVWNFEFHKLSEDLSSHEAYDKITTTPHKCFVALSKADSRL
ncbi:hypothetical protein AAE478_009912 [Parahypoxylon ruwenzoriense]